MYADTRKWVRNSWVDYVAPQLYWSTGDKSASYTKLLRWWSGLMDEAPKDHPVSLYVGQAAYRVMKSSTDPAFRKGGELNKHLDKNADRPNVAGDIFFSARDLMANRLHLTDDLTDGPYKHPSLPPTLARAPGGDPPAVAGPRAARDGGDTRLNWSKVRNARAYAIYRFTKAPGRCGFADNKHLVALTAGKSYTDDHKDGRYYVSAVDQAGRESGAAEAK